MSPAEVEELFLADVNKDGRLNEEELIEHFSNINKTMTKEQVVLHVRDIVEKFDVNNDRKLSRVEFFAYDPALRKAVISALKQELGKVGILGLGDGEGGQVFECTSQTDETLERYAMLYSISAHACLTESRTV